MASNSRLFKPLRVGQVDLAHRIAMAPMTRFRAEESHTPLQPLVSEYYGQRASVPGTLLISEATFISPQAGGYAKAPGIYSEAHIASWRKVTDAVHAHKSYLFCQLWALGRAAPQAALAEELGPGAAVVSASDIPMAGGDKPEPLTEAGVRQYIADYAQAARNAVAAGFDGVEIHGAHGYLVDQFLQDVSNARADAWGGSIENRARFALEVTKAVAQVVGAHRTAIRLSPFSRFQSMSMDDPIPQFTYLVTQLNRLQLAYLHMVDTRVEAGPHADTAERLDALVNIYDGAMLLAGGFEPHTAVKAVDDDFPTKDIVVVFGRYFISNPDLVFRLQKGIALAPYDRTTFYLAGEPEGYTTPAFSSQFLESAPTTWKEE